VALLNPTLDALALENGVNGVGEACAVDVSATLRVGKDVIVKCEKEEGAEA